MPTYEYRCRACGHELEVQQSFDDDPLTECPECAGSLRKLFGSPGISFKGSGFYKTDSRLPHREKGASAASTSTSTSESTSTSSDSAASSDTGGASSSSPSPSTSATSSSTPAASTTT